MTCIENISLYRNEVAQRLQCNGNLGVLWFEHEAYPPGICAESFRGGTIIGYDETFGTGD